MKLKGRETSSKQLGNGKATKGQSRDHDMKGGRAKRVPLRQKIRFAREAVARQRRRRADLARGKIVSRGKLLFPTGDPSTRGHIVNLL